MKKKKLALFLAAVLLGTGTFLTEGTTVFADDESSTAEESSEESEVEYYTSGDYTYTLDEETGEASIYAYTGTEVDVVLPDTLDGYPVTALGNAALLNIDTAETVTIPETIVSIGDSSFYGCTALQEIIVEEGNTALKAEDGVLLTEDGLDLICYPIGRTETSYTIPDGVVEIMPSAFAQTTLTEVVFPESLFYIDSWAFAYASLESLTFPDSLTEMGQYAFAYCTGLTEVVFPDSLELLEAACFAGCENLTSVTFSDAGNLATIQMASFAGTGLTEVTIPESVTSIGYCAFGYELDMSTTVSGFTIYGVTGSQAQTYCTDEDEENDYANNFTFRSVTASSDIATSTTEADSDGETGIWKEYGKVILLGCGVVVLLAAGVVLLLSGRKKKPKEASKTEKKKTDKKADEKKEKADETEEDVS